MDHLASPPVLAGLAGLMAIGGGLFGWLLARARPGAVVAAPIPEPLPMAEACVCEPDILPQPVPHDDVIGEGGLAAPAAKPCQQRARAERREALAALDRAISSLSQLHEEASAIRRSERVLAGFVHADPTDAPGALRSRSEADAACRYMGLLHLPTCPEAGDCALAQGCLGSGRSVAGDSPSRPNPPLA